MDLQSILDASDSSDEAEQDVPSYKFSDVSSQMDLEQILREELDDDDYERDDDDDAHLRVWETQRAESSPTTTTQILVLTSRSSLGRTEFRTVESSQSPEKTQTTYAAQGHQTPQCGRLGSATGYSREDEDDDESDHDGWMDTAPAKILFIPGLNQYRRQGC
jgi:hypothetical protein